MTSEYRIEERTTALGQVVFFAQHFHDDVWDGLHDDPRYWVPGTPGTAHPTYPEAMYRITKHKQAKNKCGASKASVKYHYVY